VQLPLIMITEYALAKLYESWGVSPPRWSAIRWAKTPPPALAGVMGFEDCIGLVHLRGQLFDTVPAGGMLSVPMAEADLRPRLTGDLDMASVNAPGLCVVSGPDAALKTLAGTLAAEGVETQRIAIDIAAHSAACWSRSSRRFGDYLHSIPLNPPRLPIVSNRTGQPLTAAQATDPDYWVQHLRNTVNFQSCMATLMAVPGRVYMEMGPGRALSSLAQANGVPAGQVIPALRHPEQQMADDAWHHRQHRAPLGLRRGGRLGADLGGRAATACRCRPMPSRRSPISSNPALPPKAAPAGWPARADRRSGPLGLEAALEARRPARVRSRRSGRVPPAETWLVFADDEGLGLRRRNPARGRA
jgi:hypothetical protein